jgi:hypothetical protein
LYAGSIKRCCRFTLAAVFPKQIRRYVLIALFFDRLHSGGIERRAVLPEPIVFVCNLHDLLLRPHGIGVEVGRGLGWLRQLCGELLGFHGMGIGFASSNLRFDFDWLNGHVARNQILHVPIAVFLGLFGGFFHGVGSYDLRRVYGRFRRGDMTCLPRGSRLPLSAVRVFGMLMFRSFRLALGVCLRLRFRGGLHLGLRFFGGRCSGGFAFLLFALGGFLFDFVYAQFDAFDGEVNGGTGQTGFHRKVDNRLGLCDIRFGFLEDIRDSFHRAAGPFRRRNLAVAVKVKLQILWNRGISLRDGGCSLFFLRRFRGFLCLRRGVGLSFGARFGKFSQFGGIVNHRLVSRGFCCFFLLFHQGFRPFVIVSARRMVCRAWFGLALRGYMYT